MSDNGAGSKPYAADGTINKKTDWEVVQQKTFTKWVNAQLKRASKAPITDLVNDFENGLKFLDLVSAITDFKFNRYEKKPKIPSQKAINLNLGLKVLKENGIVPNGVGAEDIMGCNKKLILGMIWTIIHDSTIAQISEDALNAREALMVWCQRKTAGYKGVDITNWTYSWNDGLAFLALLHKHKPSLFEWSSINPKEAAKNLDMAFELGEKHFNLPAYLDAVDMVDQKPDEKSVLTQVAEYYKTFNAALKGEVAARRITKLVQLTKTNDEMKADYQDRASKLAKWIADERARMAALKFDDTVAGAKALADAAARWRVEQRPPRATEKASLDTLFNSISLKLSSNSRPPFEPEAGSTIEELEREMTLLEEDEAVYDTKVQEELQRQLALKKLHTHYESKARAMLAWLDEKERYLDAEEHIDSVLGAELKLQLLASFDEEHRDTLARVSSLGELEQKIRDLKSKDLSRVQAQQKSIVERYEALRGKAQTKRLKLGEAHAHERAKEEARVRWSEISQAFLRWTKDRSAEARDHKFGNNLEKVEKTGAKIAESEEAVKRELAARHADVKAVWGTLDTLAVKDLKYTVTTDEDCQQQVDELLSALQFRHTVYEEELERMKLKDKKQKERAKAAKEYSELLAKKRNSIDAIGGKTPRDKMKAIEKIDHKYAKNLKAKEEQVAALEEELKKMGTSVDSRRLSNSHAVLMDRHGQLDSYIENFKAALEEEERREKQREEQRLEWERKAQLEKQNLEFAKLAHSMSVWMTGVIADLQEPISAESSKDVEAQQKYVKKIISEADKRAKSFASLESMAEALAALGVSESYGYSMPAVTKQWKQVKKLLGEVTAALEKELDKQKAYETVRAEYNKKAKEFASVLTKLQKLAAAKKNDLKKALSTVQDAHKEHSDKSPLLKTLEDLVDDNPDAGLSNRVHTQFNVVEFRAQWEALDRDLTKKERLLENEILMKEMSGVTAEQLKEFKDVFDHFDHDKSGKLNKTEFKKCLTTLGEDLSDAEFEELFKSVDISGDGNIDFPEFTKLMVKRTEDQDTAEEVLTAFRMFSKGAEGITGEQLDGSGVGEPEVKYLKQEMQTIKVNDADAYDFATWTTAAFAR